MADPEQGVDVESVTEAVKSMEVRQSRKRTASSMSQSFFDAIDDELNGPLPSKLSPLDSKPGPEPIEFDDDDWNAVTANTVDISKLPLKPSPDEVGRAAAGEEITDYDCSPVAARSDKTPPEVERPYGIRRAVRRFPVTQENWENSSTSLNAADSDKMWVDTEDQ